MKKRIFLPLTLLLAFSTIKSEEVAPATEEQTTVVEIVAPEASAVETVAPEAPVTSEATPTPVTPEAVAPEQTVVVAPEAASGPQLIVTYEVVPATPAQVVEVAPAATPVAPVSEPAATPAQAPQLPAVEPAPAAEAVGIPDQAAIVEFFKLIAAYNKQVSVLKSLHELASGQEETVAVNETSVRSLLTLLESHNKQANLITKLRAALAQSYSTINAMLGSWDEDMAQLAGQKQARPAKQKQKAQTRDVNYESVKNLADSRPQS